MRKLNLLLTSLLLLFLQGEGQMTIREQLTENRMNPLGLDIRQPHFTWKLSGEGRNLTQTAYEIKVFAKGHTKAPVWHTGKIMSDQSVNIPYQGKALHSGQQYAWQVRVWDQLGKVSPWSNSASFQTGFFNITDWKAKWIMPGYTEPGSDRPSPLFRKEFLARNKISRATAYITAHGLYEARINGRRIGQAYLAPGWTSYNKRLAYQVYDITDLLQNGNNVLGVTLGSGWYRGHLGWVENKDIYGKDIALLLQIDIHYADGHDETIITDESWKSHTGSIISAEIYDGETIDARKENKGWTGIGYNDQGWSGVRIGDFPFSNLIATYNEPITKHETFTAQRIFVTPKGENVIDFGQNLVGWVILKARGKAGDSITIQHAEVLDKQGNFYTDNLRAAKATAVYILNGDPEETFEPHFTFFGFRYIKVEGIRGTLRPDDFTAVALYSDMQPTGTFTSSDPLINQLQHNIQWGQKGNFLDVPTDCPQRDERLGWTGDAQVFSRTAAFNMGVNNFFAKWLKDLAADQYANGSVPHVIPNVLGPKSGGSAGWSDVSTIIPWNMYLAYGDKKMLSDQYSSMKAWVEYIRSVSINDLWNTGSHFGDWLFYRPDDDNSGRAAVTDKYLIAQCFYAHSTQLLINTAQVLGFSDDVSAYTELLKKIKDAFVKEYVTANGRLVSGTQTAYVLALNFDMLPETVREQAAQRLVDNIKSYNNHLTTGFLGTPYLCHVLTRFGQTDMAFRLLMQKTYPSWLYPVKMGATTIWERWDGQKPDSSFQNPHMNSFNHYAYGAIGDFMYRVIAGIDTDEDGPGYKHIILYPHLGGGLQEVNASLETYYGLVRSHWKQEEKAVVYVVTVPPNTRAEVVLPAKEAGQVTENGIALSAIPAITIKGSRDGNIMIQLGSGSYQFRIAQ
ncbi:MAG: Bacterial alpha-L-rhamnosidase [Terrimonas sp.]|nr:Bacterial alpha-L-rhamnosidase [Terrimonas sp.]